jgi:hypothetical protein
MIFRRQFRFYLILRCKDNLIKSLAVKYKKYKYITIIRYFKHELRPVFKEKSLIFNTYTK